MHEASGEDDGRDVSHNNARQTVHEEVACRRCRFKCTSRAGGGYGKSRWTVKIVYIDIQWNLIIKSTMKCSTIDTSALTHR
jgi:hypothetical protein